MGCFMSQKNRKKQTEQSVAKTVCLLDNKPVLLPEPVGGCGIESHETQNHNGDHRSAPSSFRSKVRRIQHVNWLINNRPRALSAPSSFSRTEQDSQKEIYTKLDYEEEKSQRISPPSLSNKLSISVLESVQPSKSSSLSGPVSPISGPPCSDKKAFYGQPVPLPSPRPLPLPQENSGTGNIRCPPRELTSCTSPLNSTSPGSGLKKYGSFKSHGNFKGSEPMPLPTPKDCSASLRLFTYDELSAACHKFSLECLIFDGSASTMYKGLVKDEPSGQKVEVAVTRFMATSQTYKEFVNDINKIALLQHSNLAKLIGFHARENACERMLVYERLPKGSLDRLLYGPADGPPIDWSTRMRIALGAAQGLAYLHEEGPFQAMYREFKSANIHVDKDFSAKLIDYGFASYSQELDTGSNSSTCMAYLAPETSARGFLTPKSNVWSFGVVLLELLTGRENMGSSSFYPKEERNLVRWTKSFLADEFRLTLIMDPRLKSRYCKKAAKMVADLILSCLQKEPSERPTMRTAVEILKSVQDMKYSSKFPLREPSSPKNDNLQQSLRQVALSPPRPSVVMPVCLSQSQPLIVTRDSSAWTQAQAMSRSPSLNGMITSSPSCTPSSNTTLIPLKPLKPLIVPSRSCASTFALEEVLIKQCKEAASPRQTSTRVEGF